MLSANYVSNIFCNKHYFLSLWLLTDLNICGKWNTYIHLEEFHYYPLLVNLVRYNGICNTLDDLSSTTCAPNGTEDVNLNVFNMIIGINESETTTKKIE